MVEENTPKTPSQSKGTGASSILWTVYPVTTFKGEGFPDITLNGTEVTSAEAQAAKEAAEANGVELVEGGS